MVHISRSTSAGARALFALRRLIATVAATWLASACTSSTPSAEVLDLTPATVWSDVATPGSISGRHLTYGARVSLDDHGPVARIGRWRVAIGSRTLDESTVHLADAETLTITIPQGLALGPHDVHVTSPRDESFTLPNAVTVKGAPAASDAGAGGDSGPAPPLPGADAGPRPCPAGGTLNPFGSALIHRYSFCDVGTQVRDAVGVAHGTATGTPLDGSGRVSLSGAPVALPSGLISVLDNVTVELWATWSGGTDDRERFFEFGSIVSADGFQSNDSYLSMRPTGPVGTGRNLEAAFAAVGFTGIVVLTGRRTPVNLTFHAALVVDGDAGEVRLYQEAQLRDTQLIVGRLPQINDVECWLGRNLFGPDPNFQGELLEFRLYDQAFTESELALSLQAGHDARF